jgi:hypothetical protein
MMNELTVEFCEAALAKLYAFAPHLLTSQDGYMSEGKISVADQTKLAHVSATILRHANLFSQGLMPNW